MYRGAEEAERFGDRATAAKVDRRQLEQTLSYPPDLGPTEWDPSPFLPEVNACCLQFMFCLALCRGAGDAEGFGAKASAAEIEYRQLKQILTYPPVWGPTKWGRIPFLP